MTGDRIWGLGEAALAWLASVFFSVLIYGAMLAAGGYSAFTPQRTGGFLGRATAQLLSDEPLRDNAVPLTLVMASLVPGWIILLGVVWYGAGVVGHQRPGWTLKGTLSDIPVGIATGVVLQVPIMVIVAILMQMLLGDFEPSGRALALVDSIDSPVEVIALVLGVAVGAPIVEELFYRGVVQASLVSRFGPAIGIGVTSIIFGAVHLSAIEFAPLAVAGLGFGLLAWRRGRLLPAIIAHMTFNTFTLVLLFASALTL